MIDREEVLHVATLARLALREDEIEPMARELSAIVDLCLAKRRDQRFSSVLALARALEPWAPKESVALIGRIERILAGRDDQATLDISPIVHLESSPTQDSAALRRAIRSR